MPGEIETCQNSELIRVLEQLPEGILVVDSEAVILFANKTGSRLIKLKPKKAVGSTFAYDIADGTMRDFDVEMTVKEISWSDQPARMICLKSLKSSGAFHLEWKLEAAVEKARDLELELEELKNNPPAAPAAAPVPAVDESYYEERIQELESLLDLAEQRADRLEQDIALDDHTHDQALQDALKHARDAEDQVRQLEGDLQEAQERVRIAEEQAEVAEERAYAVELELEQVAGDKEDVQSSIDELTTEVEDLRVMVSTWRETADRLTSEAEAHEAEKAEIRAQLEAASARVGELESQNEAASQQPSQAQEEELVQLREELYAARGEIETVRAELAEAQAGAGKSSEESDTLKSDLQTKGEELERLQAELQASAVDLAAAGESLQAKEAELEILRGEMQELKGSAEIAAEESDELAEQLRVEQEQFEERAAAIREEMEQLQERTAQLEADLEASQEENEGLRGQSEELESQLAELSAASEESERLREQVAEMGSVEHECDTLKKEIRRLETLLHNAEELAQKGERVEKLERKLEGALRRAEEAEERLSEERRLLSEMRARVESSAAAVPAPQSTADVDPETERLAFQDPHTGLPNRNIINRYLSFMLKQSARHGRFTVMMRLDCDNFRSYNETFGQPFGDQLLRAVGERLSSVVRGTDVLGRFEEDEFIILLSELTDQDEASVMTASVIKRVYQTLRQPFVVEGQSVQVSVSIGVSIYPIDARNGEQMFEHSATALRNAKESGRGKSQHYTSDLQTRHDARNELDLQLKKGLEGNEFELLYQPIFDLTTSQIIGVESLIRWAHPQHGTLNPESFLQVAEDSGMIVLIGNWAVRTALKDAAEWQKSGLGLVVSINLSRRQLMQAELVPSIGAMLDEFGCARDRILFEVPEDLTGPDAAKIRETLNELNRIGVRLAIDNFGTSSTSLQDLRRGPFQVIKVDRKFVRGVPGDEENTGIVLSALTLGHHLGRMAIAVGVENENERAWLAQTGARFAQGNALSPPLPASQIPSVVKGA